MPVCGIFGFLAPRGDARASGSVLETATASLHHRGPDGAGHFLEAAGEMACGLAHTRLSIVDLSDAGAQPMWSADRRHVLVFNGEIYNFHKIRTELEALGARFRSTSDTQVVLEALIRWGRPALERFRGMFALALWDRFERRLLLARDRFGVKPLYVRALPHGGVAFASEVRTLLATGFAGRQASRASLDAFLEFGSVSEPHTMLADVDCLPAGHCWEFSEGQHSRPTAYYELSLRPPLRLSRAEIVARVRTALEDAVALRLEADVPVGVFLSSGIDSSAVAILAAKAATKPIYSFTVTFDRVAPDEGEGAKRLASTLGLVHREANLATVEIGAQIERAVAALDQPSADGINTYFVSRAARDAGLAVALSGIGGDELFAGYASFRRFERLRRLSVFPLRGGVRDVLKRAAALSRLPMETRKALELAASDGSSGQQYAHFRAMFTFGQRRRLSKVAQDSVGMDSAFVARVDEALRGGAIDAVTAFGVLELTHYLRNTLLRDTDCMSMAHALEVREPLLDHQLVELAFQVPGHMKLEGQGNKPILTEAVPEIPRMAQMAAKRGFTLPFEQWMRGSLRSWVEERLFQPGTLPIEQREVSRLWRSYLEGRREVSWARVWSLAVLSDWCVRHRVTFDASSFDAASAFSDAESTP